jgi:hypothetical protein
MATRTDTQSPARHVADSHDLIRVHGARVNNLKDISVDIPKRRLTVFTGVSGSGKSSLVFGTIAAESQRMINETYSAFVQGFMPTPGRPEVDVLEGLTTAIIVDQERMGGDARSTVGTATDANAMLRILRTPEQWDTWTASDREGRQPAGRGSVAKPSMIWATGLRIGGSSCRSERRGARPDIDGVSGHPRQPYRSNSALTASQGTDSPGSPIAASASAASAASSAARRASITDSGDDGGHPLAVDGQMGDDTTASQLDRLLDGWAADRRVQRGPAHEYQCRQRSRTISLGICAVRILTRRDLEGTPSPSHRERPLLTEANGR